MECLSIKTWQIDFISNQINSLKYSLDPILCCLLLSNRINKNIYISYLSSSKLLSIIWLIKYFSHIIEKNITINSHLSIIYNSLINCLFIPKIYHSADLFLNILLCWSRSENIALCWLINILCIFSFRLYDKIQFFAIKEKYW